MLTCEKCGKSFEQPDGQIVEVTSLRVLCPTCTAARAAAKARQAAPSGVRASGEAPAKDAPGASIPAKKVQTRPESTHVRPASAQVRPPPAHVRPESANAHPAHANPRPESTTARPKPAPAAAAPTSAPGPRPARPAPAARKPEKKHRIDPDTLASHDLQKKGSREVWVSFGVAVLVFAVAGGVLWKVLGQKAAEKAESDRIQARVDEFRNTFRAFDISTEDGARHLISYGEENKSIWEPRDDLGSEVVNRTAKAKDFLERLEAQKELQARLDAIEQVMAKAAELPPSELAEQLRRLDELKLKASIVGPEFEARIDKDRADGERVHMERLLATAEAAAAANPLDRAALTTLGTVEDDVHRVFENVYRLWDKNKQDVPLSDKKKDYEDKYKRVIALSDDAVERFFSPEVVEGVPWRDLLSDATAWKTSELKGYEHNIKDGVLSLVGPDPSADGQGVMSIGDKEIWRDFIVEMEFTIEQGNCELFFRLSPVWQKNVESRELSTDEHLEAGRSYSFVFSVIASTLVEEQQGEEPLRDRVSWTQIRKGAFGLAVPKNTRIKFTKMRARVLR